jgi:hypothetical protein
MNAAGQFAMISSLALSLTTVGRDSIPSVQIEDCGSGPSSYVPVVLKSPILSGKPGGLRAVGQVSYRRNNEADVVANRCHVEYTLLVSYGKHPFSAVKRWGWHAEEGEIAGIDLVGFSPNGNWLAADFWTAEGDHTEHRPVIYDLAARKAAFRPLGSLIQERIYGCDQEEDFLGVTDAGEAILAVPPSIYDDSPGCGDKGMWHFNLETGKVTLVAKISGDKWR